MRKSVVFVLPLVMVLCVPSFMTAEEAVKGLPPNELAKYCDPFDKLREDLWESLHLVETEKQTANFVAGEVGIENGRVRFETRPGGFSKAGFAGKFWFKGDFDVQVDCDFAFLNNVSDMDQRVFFIVQERGKHFRDADLCLLEFSKKPGESGWMRLLCQSYWKPKWVCERKLEEFRGTLRFVRTGKTVQCLYRESGKEEWTKLGSCNCGNKDMGMAFAISNFLWGRNSIQADTVLSVTFDNFKINAAQGIGESAI